MRLKPVPPVPDSLDALRDVQRAVPLVPGTEEDCCARIVARTSVADRDDASDWLSFLRALGLARETDSGFVREQAEPGRETLAERFRTNVYGAREIRDVLGDDALSADAVFERFDAVPRWERSRNPDWKSTWYERVERLLDWSVLLGLAARTEDGYVAEDGT